MPKLSAFHTETGGMQSYDMHLRSLILLCLLKRLGELSLWVHLRAWSTTLSWGALKFTCYPCIPLSWTITSPIPSISYISSGCYFGFFCFRGCRWDYRMPFSPTSRNGTKVLSLLDHNSPLPSGIRSYSSANCINCDSAATAHKEIFQAILQYNKFSKIAVEMIFWYFLFS